MTNDSPEVLFAKVIDRISLYEVGTYILGLNDDELTETQKDFKRCYDLWLGLGNGFYDVCNGTYLASLPRGVAAFERIGATLIATAGRLVLAEFECRNLPTTEDEIDLSIIDEAELERIFLAIEKIDRDYMSQIWDAALVTEQQLIALASVGPEPTNTEHAAGDGPPIRREST